MAGFLGIDHPLILVRDIEEAVGRFGALGFRMTPVGKHPWAPARPWRCSTAACSS